MPKIESDWWVPLNASLTEKGTGTKFDYKYRSTLNREVTWSCSVFGGLTDQPLPTYVGDESNVRASG
jgi:hypothetical protein